VPTRIVDLTLTLKDGLRTWDIKPPFTLLPYMNAATFRLGFSTKLLVMEDHTGTHVDASLHFYDGVRRTPRGRSIAELPLDKLHGEAVCIDVSAKRADEPVTAEMLAVAVASSTSRSGRTTSCSCVSGPAHGAATHSSVRAASRRMPARGSSSAR